jgi:small ligand-binding sensory domain FIST
MTTKSGRAMRAVGALVKGPFQEEEVRELAVSLRRQLGEAPDVALLFVSGDYQPFLSDLLELVTIHGQVRLLAGCTASSVIGEGREWEDRAGLSLCFLSLPGCRVTPLVLKDSVTQAVADPGEFGQSPGLPGLL